MIPPLVVGSASRDLTSDDPRGWRLGGAAAYCGLALARLGLRPRVLLGVDPEAAGAAELGLLRDAGADLCLRQLNAGPVFRNRSTPNGRVQDCIEPGLPLVPTVPTEWADGETWLLVPVADELGVAWAEVPPAGAFVALGWQGLLRNLPRGSVVTRRSPTPNALVHRAGLVSLSREDVEASTTMTTLGALLHAPATLVLTDGPAGGTIWTLHVDGSHRERRYPAIWAAAAEDPTGAGDTFLGALVAGRLRHPLARSGRHGSDVRLAAAVASLTVEAPGLHGVPRLAAVVERLRRP